MIRALKTIWLSLALLVIGCVYPQTISFADVGDIGVYREATGTEDEDNQTFHDEAFDTIVHEDTTEFTQDSGDVLIELDSGGHYFVWYTLHFEVTSGGGADRTVHIGRLEVGGTTVEAGYGQGYTRAAGGELQAYISGGAIINAAAGDDLKVEAQNASNNTTEALERRPNLNGVSVLKLDDDWDYLRIHESTGGTDYNNATMTDYTWDTVDELDTGSFSYTAGNANVTLEQAGHYLVTYTIRMDRASNGNRMQMQSQVTIGGTAQEHCHSGTYIRGNLAGDIIEEGAIAGVCVVEATAGQDLVVQVQRASTSTGTTITDIGDAAGLTIVKLPDQADYIRIHENGGTQDVAGTDEVITWDFEDEEDAAFTHNTLTNTGTIEVNEDGHYLFTGCLHADRTSSGVRYPYIKQWRIDGTTQQYGAFGAYNRGDQGTFDAFDSSNCGAVIFDDMTAGEEVDLTVTTENGQTTGAPTFTANEMGITAIYLDSLFMTVEGDTDLSNGTTVSLAVNGTFLQAHSDVSGGKYAITVGVDHISSGDVVTVFGSLVTDANEATSITKYDGTGNITGLDLNKNRLTIGSDDNASLTLTDVSQYTNTDSEDVMHLTNSGTILIVDGGDDYASDSIDIVSGNTLTVGSMEGIVGHDVDMNGTMTASGTLHFSGSWDSTGGIFNGSGSTVVFTGTTSETIRSGGEVFNSVMINDGLVGYWRFDETTSPSQDYSGYELDGVWGGSTTTSTTIPDVNFANTRSALFDGTGDDIDIGQPEVIENLSNGFTITAWINHDTLSGVDRVFSADRTNSANGWAFGTNGTGLRFTTYGVLDYNSTTITLTTGTWYHVAAVFDSSNDVTFYVDGTSQTQTIVGASPVTANTDDTWHIGADPGSEEYDGFIDDLRIYDRELSSAEIVRLAAGNTPALTRGSYALQDTMDANGSVYLHGGTLDVNGNDMLVAGDWFNTGGVFDDETRTVTMDGGNQDIDYTETFFNLTKSVTTTGTLAIGKDSTITIAGALSLSGASGNLLGVESSTFGTRHTWNVTAGDQNVSFLQVEDSASSSNDIIATFSTDSSNNDSGEGTPNWIFASTFYWVGSAGGDTNDPGNWASAANACGVGGGSGVPGSTDVATFQANCDNDATVDVNFNVAALDIQSGYTGTITPNAGISIDVDGPYTQADGTIDFSVNNNDLNVFGNFTKTGGTFTPGSGNVTFDGALNLSANTGTNLGEVTISASPDISVTLASDVQMDTLTLGSGDTLNTDGYEMDVNGLFDINGILNATDGSDGRTTINISGDWDMTGGTFMSTNSTVRFDAVSGTTDIISDDKSFNNIVIDDGGGGSLVVELEDTLDVNGSLIITDGTLDVKSGENNNITIAGNWDNDDTFTARSANLTFDGSTAQTVSNNAGTFNVVEITNSDAAVTFDEAFTATDFTDTTPGSVLRFQQSTTFTISGDLTLTGTLGSLIDINSVDDTTQFDFDITGSGNETVSFVRVEHSRVANGSGNDIIATQSINEGNNDDGDSPPTDQWVFLIGEPDYMHPDIGIPGMNLVIQIIGANFRDDSVVTTSSADIVVGTTVVTDDTGAVVTTAGRVITASFFILPSASAEIVTVTVDGIDVDQTFEIVSSVTAGDCDFTGDSGTITIGDGAADHGTRTEMGVILCDELIIPSGLTVDIDVTDSDGSTAGNQGYMPAMIIVDGTVNIEGEINVDGSAGAVNVGDAGGAGGDAGPGGGGGGSGGGQDATQNDGGDGFTGGGGGSCENDSASCNPGGGGDGTGQTGGAGVGKGGNGGATLVAVTTGGVGGTGDLADGAGGSGGTGFAFGTSGSGASDPATNGTGGSGGGAGAFDGNAGGGGFGEAGVDGIAGTGGAITGNDQLVPFMGGSGGGAGGSSGSGGGGGGGAGGALVIVATGTITIDGIVSADGGAGAVGTDGDGGGGSGGSIVLQAPEVQTGSGQWDTDGGTGTAAGGDGRIRVDGLPTGTSTIAGTISDANTTEFVGPAITDITTTQVIGTAANTADIDIHITNGVTSSTTSGSADANGDYAISVTYLSGANYITVVMGTLTNVEVMSTAALGVLSVDISGTSNLTAGTTIRCAQNGGLLNQSTTISGGTFTITGINKPDTDDVITCWADGVDEDDESTAVTKYDGTGDITGLILNRHELTIGSNENQNITVSNLGQYDQDDDEDIMHTSNSNVFRVDPSNVDYADDEIVILFSNSLTVASSETLTAHGLDIDGTLILSGAATVNISGTFDATGAGTFSEGSSVITLNGTMDQSIMPDGDNFYDLTVNNSGASGDNDIVIIGTLDIDNDINITDGDLDQGTNSALITIFGDWTVSTNGTLTTGTSTVTFDGTSTNQNVSAGSVPFYDVIVNNTAGAPDDRLLVTGTMAINGDVEITDGRIDLDLNDGNMEVAGDLIIGVGGGFVGGATTETILFDGVMNQTFTTNSQEFNNIRINNMGAAGTNDSVILTDALDMSGTLNIVDGDLDPDTNSVNINLEGNWIMGINGTFDAGVGSETVVFDGDNQTITGSTTFNNLSKIESTNDGVDTDFIIEAGSTQTITGLLTLNGLDDNDRINLDSGGTAFFFDVFSSQTVDLIVIQNSETLRNDIIATNSVDNGGTDSLAPSPHWVFSQNRFWVGATNPANTNLVSSWASTEGACGTGGASIPTIANDAIFTSSCTNDATVDANFTIAALEIQSGYTGTITTNSSIVIDMGSTYTQASGTLDLSTNGGEMQVAGNFLTTGGAIVNTTGTITIDGIATIDAVSGSNLGNIVISPPGSNTVTLLSDITVEDMTITTADQLDADGYEVTINDDITISGTLDITNGADGISTVVADGGWLATGGMFNQGAAILTFTSSDTALIASGDNSFIDITFNGTGPWILQDDMDLNDGLDLLSGTLDANNANSQTINISGVWNQTAGVFLPRQGTVVFDQTSGTQVIPVATSFYSIVLDDGDGGGDLTGSISGTLDIGGTLQINDGLFELDGHEAFIGGNVDINDTLDASSGSDGNVSIYVEGSWDMTGGTFANTDSTVIFSGITSQSITSNTRSFNNVTINNALIAYWPLDESTSPSLEVSGNNYHGTWSGSVVLNASVSGTINFADSGSAEFDGADDYIEINDRNDLDLTGGEFTIAAWIFPDDFGQNLQGRIIDKNGDTGGADGWAFLIDDNLVTEGLTLYTNNVANSSNANVILTSQWQHVAVTFDNGAVTYYVNGISEGTNVAVATPVANTDVVRIGIRSSDLNRDFDGLIDDVRIYDRALTANEMLTMAGGNMPAINSGTYTLQDDLDVNGTLMINAGELNAGADRTIDLDGSWLNHGGIFTANNGQVTLNSTSTPHRILTGAQAFYDIDINDAGGTWQLEDNLLANNVLDMSDGTLTYANEINVEPLTVVGDMTLTGGTFTGNANRFRHEGLLQITTGVYTAPSDTLELDQSFDHIGGTFTNSSATVMFTGTTTETIDTTGGGLFNNMIVNTGLIAYWRLDEAASPAYDSSGYHHTGFWTGASTDVSVSGSFNFENSASVDFDGSNDYIEFPDSDLLDLSNGSFTLSAWIFPDNFGQNLEARILDKDGETSDQDGWAWLIDDNGINNAMTMFINNVEINSNATIINTGQWQHVAVTLDGGQLTFYVDGISQGTTASVATPGANDSAVRMGIRARDTNRDFNGRMDDIRIYDHALSIQEIELLRTGYQPRLNLGTYTLQTDLDVNGTIELDSGALDVSASNRTINIGAGWINQGGVFDARSGTIVFDGNSTAYQIISAEQTFYNIDLDDGDGGGDVSWVLRDDLDVDGTLQISEGTLDVSSISYDVFTAGNWRNRGSFSSQTGTVYFDGTVVQTITTCDGCTAGNFTNIVIDNNNAQLNFLDAFSVVDFTGTLANTSLTFEAGRTVTITGSLNLDGQAAGTRIFLNSSDGVGRFEFDVTGGDQTVTAVNVSNSEASTNDITAVNSIDTINTDSGDAPATAQWIFLRVGPLKGAVIIVD